MFIDCFRIMQWERCIILVTHLNIRNTEKSWNEVFWQNRLHLFHFLFHIIILYIYIYIYTKIVALKEIEVQKLNTFWAFYVLVTPKVRHRKRKPTRNSEKRQYELRHECKRKCRRNIYIPQWDWHQPTSGGGEVGEVGLQYRVASDRQ